MSTVSASFTAVGAGSTLSLQPGQSFTYSVSGTFVGTIKLQRSLGEGAWPAVLSATGAASGTITNESPNPEVYRFYCSAYTSGTAVTAMVEVVDEVQVFRNPEGTTVLAITDEGIDTPKITTESAIVNSAGVGAANGATVSATEYGDGVWHKTVLTCTATPITIADDAGVAQYGGVKIYDFPEGLICTQGAVIDGAVTLGATGTIINTWAGGIALGTATATTGATLTGTEADILPEVDVAAATAKVAVVDAVSVATALTESGARWLDGTATAKDLFLNLVVDDDASHTAGTGTFTGTVTIIWAHLGDK